MIDISIIHPGDKVRIVDAWNKGCHQNPDGLMDRYLGQVVTVNKVLIDRVRILEDEGRWSWFAPALLPSDYHDPLDDLMLESEEDFAASLQLLGL